MNLELINLGNGNVRLAYWDSLHGEDRIFILRADGTVMEWNIHDDDKEALTPVDLIKALREIVGG